MKNNAVKEERMMVLNMVSEGKISVEDSIKLLELLSDQTNEFKADYGYRYDYDFEEKINNFSRSVDEFAKDVSEKVSCAYKGVEPKVKSATKTVVQKTVSILEDISSSLNETLKNLDTEEPSNCEDDKCPEEKNDDDTPIAN